MAVFAPIPRARVKMAVKQNIGLLRSTRRPKMKSPIQPSMSGTSIRNLRRPTSRERAC